LLSIGGRITGNEELRQLKPDHAQKALIIFDCDGTLVDFEIRAVPRIYPELTQVLKNLVNEGHTLMVWTARNRASTLAILKELAIMPLFQDMRCADDCLSKPHPMGLRELHESDTLTRQAMGLPPRPLNKILMIGDTSRDIEGARAYGIDSLLVLWGYGEDKDKARKFMVSDHSLPWGICDTPKECEQKIKEYLEEKHV
jgi:phosphoglycolate phosphatase-like HAD superfamily hydrolase